MSHSSLDFLRIMMAKSDVIVGFYCRFGIVLMRAWLSIVLTVWLTLLASQPAPADKRVALVIGNSSYRTVANESTGGMTRQRLPRCSSQRASTSSTPD